MPNRDGEVGVEGVRGPTKAVLSRAFFEFFNHSKVSSNILTFIFNHHPNAKSVVDY